jgi:hypothetical protein
MNVQFDAILKNALVESVLDEYQGILNENEVLSRKVHLKYENSTDCDYFSADCLQQFPAKESPVPIHRKRGDEGDLPADGGEI